VVQVLIRIPTSDGGYKWTEARVKCLARTITLEGKENVRVVRDPAAEPDLRNLASRYPKNSA
jgi:hypothetical protein